MKTTLHKASGFTLIEMVMIIVLVGIGLVPLMNMFYGSGRSMSQSDFVTIATELAQKKLDGYIQGGYAALPGSASGTFAAPFAAYSWSETATSVDENFLSAGSTNYKKVIITVTGSGQTLTLTTVLANHS